MVYTPLIIRKHNRISNFKQVFNVLVTNFVRFVLSTFKISLFGKVICTLKHNVISHCCEFLLQCGDTMYVG
jgi:hypothetical protein